MTDEEMALEWISKYVGQRVEVIKAVQLSYYKNLEKAYLAGLKAGRDMNVSTNKEKTMDFGMAIVALKRGETVGNCLTGIIAIAERQNNEYTDVIKMLALQADRILYEAQEKGGKKKEIKMLREILFIVRAVVIVVCLVINIVCLINSIVSYRETRKNIKKLKELETENDF
jgi:hypothetical protein